MFNRVYCGLHGHSFTPLRAFDRVEGGGRREYSDGRTERIDTCTLREECLQCGRVRESSSFVRSVERHAEDSGITLAWDDSATESDDEVQCVAGGRDE